jgi:hypothetical protein
MEVKVKISTGRAIPPTSSLLHGIRRGAPGGRLSLYTALDRLAEWRFFRDKREASS